MCDRANSRRFQSALWTESHGKAPEAALKFIASRHDKGLRLTYRALHRCIVGRIAAALAHGHTFQFTAREQRHQKLRLGVALHAWRQRDARPHLGMNAVDVFLILPCGGSAGGAFGSGLGLGSLFRFQQLFHLLFAFARFRGPSLQRSLVFLALFGLGAGFGLGFGFLLQLNRDIRLRGGFGLRLGFHPRRGHRLHARHGFGRLRLHLGF